MNHFTKLRGEKRNDGAELPFRRLAGECNSDAVAYCPVCQCGEVHIRQVFTSHLDMIAYSDGNGFRVANIPSNGSVLEFYQKNHGRPWQAVLCMECCNGHKFDIAFLAKNGLTWAEVSIEDSNEPVG